MTLEERVETLERLYNTLYQRAYARNVRRIKAHEKRTHAIEAAARRAEQYDGLLQRLGKVLPNLEKGKILMTFSPQQRNYLEFLLRRKLDPVTFHPHVRNIKCSKCGYIWARRVDRPKVCPKCCYRFKEKKKEKRDN